MPEHSRIAARLYGRPLLMTADAALTVAAAFSDAEIRSLTRGDDESNAARLAASPANRPTARARLDALAIEGDVVALDDGRGCYGLTTNGTAIVSIIGELTPRWSWQGALSGLTSYDTLRRLYAAIGADARVRAVLLDIDSPGGLTIDCAATAAALARLAAEKPVWACANGMACSAAYWNAAPAARLTVTPAGVTGSIGAVIVLRDDTAADAKAGTAYRIIRAGEMKMMGGPHETPSDEFIARLTVEVGRTRDAFAEAVASYRSAAGLTVATVLGTRSAVLPDHEAVELKVADGISTLEDTLLELEEATRAPSVGTRVKPPAASATRTGEQTMLKSSVSEQPPENGEETEENRDDAAPEPVDDDAEDGEEKPEVVPPAPAVDPVARAKALARAANVSTTLINMLLNAGAASERSRLSDIDAATLPGCEALAADHKERGLSVAAFIGAQNRALREIGGNILGSMRSAGEKQDRVPSATAPSASSADPDRAWRTDAALRASFAGEKADYDAFVKATTKGLVRGV